MNIKKVYLQIFTVVFLLVLLPQTRAEAAMTPLAIGIAPPVQFPPQDFDIVGLRLSALWGKHRAMYGVDLGVIGNITVNDFVGLSVAGGFNKTQSNTTILGLQLAGITNINMQKTKVFGVQAAGLVNYNEAESSVAGLQISMANLAKNTTIYGVQAGIYNNARRVNGFQIGIVNATNSLRGLQIGLVNFNHTGIFKVAPILNVGF